MKFIIKSEQTLLAELNAYFQTHPELYSRFGLPENGVITQLPADVKDARFNDVFLDMYGGKLVLLEGEVQECQQTFQSKYRASDSSQSFYSNLNFPWTAFSNTATEGVPPANAVLGFIHRYDTQNSRWWLSAERFTIPAYAGPQSYPMTSAGTLFDMPSDGELAPYSGGLLQGSGSLYDPNYFTNVLCDNAPVNNNTYVNRVANAWAELSQLYTENFNAIENAQESLFSINFCSISSDYSAQVPGTVLVPFPHTITMYMSYDGQALLTDGAVIASTQFVNHAADLGSLCPTHCSQYTWPTGLLPL